MSPEQRERAEALFLQLAEANPSSWRALLQEKCPDDPAVRDEVASLLGYHDRAGSFLDHAALLKLTPEVKRLAEAPLQPGTRLGEYTIEKILGAGGMGVVYVARQEKPRRTIALKLVSAAASSPGLLRRFEHEAEILGRLQHPGIAQIFEAGAADLGEPPARRPFIAMELVDGPNLIDHAERAALNLHSRLALMAKVADAVQHAHQRGVIHRDLKPANILVDPTGQPKVLDFGVARATWADAPLATMQTSMGQLIGTLPYMSPEQVLGDPAEVDTRSDVYALGVILFELLTGKLPLDLSRRALPDAVAAIRSEDPLRLSSVSRIYRGDVETIVAKALEKDKARRYQSAADLAADIERYLAGQPISAKDDSAFYILRKRLKRYRGALAVGAMMLIALVVFSVYASLQAAAQSRLAAEERAARKLATARAEELRRNLYVSAIGFAQAAYAGRDMGRMKRVLASCPEDLRGWEWRYLTSLPDTSDARHYCGNLRLSRVLASPDADLSVEWTHSEDVIVRQRSTWAELARFDPRGEIIDRAAFLNGSDRLFIGTTSGRAIVWDWKTCEEHAAQSDSRLRLTWMGNWPDNSRVLAVGALDGQTSGVYSFGTHDGRVRASFTTTSAYAGAVSPDGARVAIGENDGSVCMFDQQGKLLWRAKGHRLTVRSLQFSPDGSRLATGGNDGFVRVYPVEGGSPLEIQAARNKITALSWSPDSRHIAASGTEAAIGVFDAATGAEIAALYGHDVTVDLVQWLPEDHLFTWSFDAIVRVWHNPVCPRQPAATLPDGVYTACWSPDGSRIYAGVVDHSIVALDARTLQPVAGPVRVSGVPYELAPTPDGSRLAAVMSDGSGCILDAASLQRRADFRVGGGRGIDVSFDPTGQFFVVGCDWPELQVRRATDAAVVRTFPRQSTSAIRATWSPDGRVIAGLYYDSIVRLHDADTGRVIRELRGPRTWSTQARFSRDSSKLFVSSADSAVYIWDLASDRPPRTLVGHQKDVNSVSLSPDETRVATGGWDNTVRVWDADLGLELLTMRPHIGAVWSTEFSPDGRTLLSASTDGTLKLWIADEPGRAPVAEWSPPALTAR
ncbi:MAG: protein kinase [Planctomycetota bacterium]|nr:protein kinase [Planctomycetota bacterium]